MNIIKDTELEFKNIEEKFTLQYALDNYISCNVRENIKGVFNFITKKYIISGPYNHKIKSYRFMLDAEKDLKLLNTPCILYPLHKFISEGKSYLVYENLYKFDDKPSDLIKVENITTIEDFGKNLKYSHRGYDCGCKYILPEYRNPLKSYKFMSRLSSLMSTYSHNEETSPNNIFVDESFIKLIPKLTLAYVNMWILQIKNTIEHVLVSSYNEDEIIEFHINKFPIKRTSTRKPSWFFLLESDI